jgi:hypothetical protein
MIALYYPLISGSTVCIDIFLFLCYFFSFFYTRSHFPHVFPRFESYI